VDLPTSPSMSSDTEHTHKSSNGEYCDECGTVIESWGWLNEFEAEMPDVPLEEV